MPLKPIPLGPQRVLLADSLAKLAAGLKAGECYPLRAVAAELKVNHSSVHAQATRLGLIQKQYVPGKNRDVCVLINPKFAPKS